MAFLAIMIVLWFIIMSFYVDWFEKYERKQVRKNSFPNDYWGDF